MNMNNTEIKITQWVLGTPYSEGYEEFQVPCNDEEEFKELVNFIKAGINAYEDWRVERND